MREIITLQLGNLSNYTATHFWNAQESYFTYSAGEESAVDHDVHWRQGIGVDGSETFLPRTVIYDLKGGFGSLRKINSLYDTAINSKDALGSLWSGEPAVYKQESVEPSAYQQSLDAGTQPAPLTTSTVRYWSDYTRAYFHPRSSVQIYDFELHSLVRPFENFSMGTELFSSLNKEDDIIDRDWRSFVEECDLMQGIQVFTSIDDAWGGFGSSYIEQLRDEYPKSCIWVWGVQSPVTGNLRDKFQLRAANVAQCLNQVYSQASVFSPLALPESSLLPTVELDRSSAWHTSALLATMAESALIPTRLKDCSHHVSMSDLAEYLNTSGKQILASAGLRPFPETAHKTEETESISLFHIGHVDRKKKNIRNRIFGQITSCRGHIFNGAKDEDSPTNRRHQRGGNTVMTRFTTTLEFPLLDSYPQIYYSATGRSTLPVHTFLRTDTTMCERIRALRTQARRLIGLDEREGLSNSIAEIADAYQDDWSSGSDDDDDDL